MDPRRARDPRLARGDPRLQRIASGSPAPQPPQQQQQQQQPHHSTPWPFSDPYATSSQTVPQQVPYRPPSANTTVNVAAPSSNDRPEASTYKPRPLFCVVCASNQVL
ncbi:hypothetical protein PAXRUDRAFT_822945 [Paxillus rubicundulus Ve08.2h10]|uniref:Uncharacterized protein n=1 Tax=Paxillus rubicundulus Ve08.2h10 TaxID=930991 RepID=A0A0D0E4F8_9AGAM|nr:hypothetical protein PAXRUDRAFT_822945 [Paxillus rubicundulus Ve08.2h10]